MWREGKFFQLNTWKRMGVPGRKTKALNKEEKISLQETTTDLGTLLFCGSCLPEPRINFIPKLSKFLMSGRITAITVWAVLTPVLELQTGFLLFFPAEENARLINLHQSLIPSQLVSSFHYFSYFSLPGFSFFVLQL